MLLRIRWFLLGVVGAVGAGAYVTARLRRLRAALTPANVARASADGVAGLLAAAARRIAPKPR